MYYSWDPTNTNSLQHLPTIQMQCNQYQYQYGGIATQEIRGCQMQVELQIQMQDEQDSQHCMDQQLDAFVIYLNNGDFRPTKEYGSVPFQNKQQWAGNRKRKDESIELTQLNPKILTKFERHWKLQIINIPKIRNTEFVNLKSMNLSSNYIVSLEGIAYIQCPTLQQLTLTDNMINSIRSLRKCQFPTLKKLSMDVNQIGDLQTLCQAKLADLQCIQIDRYYWVSNGQSIAFVCKLEAHHLRKCVVYSKFRLISESFMNAMNRKYPGAMLSI